MTDLGLVPRLSSGVVLEALASQHYLYLPDHQSYVLLDNEVALEVVRLCDGRNTIRDICRLITDIFSGASLDVVIPDVGAMLQILEDELVLEFSAPDGKTD